MIYLIQQQYRNDKPVNKHRSAISPPDAWLLLLAGGAITRGHWELDQCFALTSPNSSSVLPWPPPNEMQIGLHNLGHHLSKLVCRVWIPTRHPYASAVSIISLISPCQTINYTSSLSVCWWLVVPIHSGVQWSKRTERER